ncbi:MAG: Tfp pilus assembly protein FimT/FimU, partial [Chthoniobacterales bacterium]
MISATGNRSRSAGFSLVELLTVVVIMAIIMGVVGYGVSGMQRPGLQVAASQVASGLSLARQLAITRNTSAAFLVATTTNGSGLPAQPYRYWAVASSNRGANTWTLRKDWEKLADGVVFLHFSGIAPVSYSPINSSGNAFPAGISVGVAAVPPVFVGTSDFSVTAGGTNFTFTSMPAIRFTSEGSAAGSST